MNIFSKFFIFMKIFSQKQHVLHYAAQMAYRFLLAFTPLMMLLYNFFKWLSTDISNDILKGIHLLFPFFMDDFLNDFSILNVQIQSSFWSNLVFLFFLIYASVCAVRSIIITFDKMLNTSRPFTPINYFYIWGKAFICFLLIIPAVLFVLSMYFFTQSVSTIILDSLNFWQVSLNFWEGFSLVYILSIIILLSTAVYMFFPSKHLSFLNALPGGIITGMGWLSILVGYRLFLKSQFYSNDLLTFLKGPFAFIIVVYIFCIILTFGNAVNFFFSKYREAVNENL